MNWNRFLVSQSGLLLCWSGFLVCWSGFLLGYNGYLVCQSGCKYSVMVSRMKDKPNGRVWRGGSIGLCQRAVAWCRRADASRLQYWPGTAKRQTQKTKANGV